LALRDLGLQPGLQDYRAAHLYTTVSSALSEWILTGDAGITVDDGLAVKKVDADASPTDRKQAVLDVLKDNIAGYTVAIAEYEETARLDPNQLGPIHGIWPGMSHHLIRALTELQGAVDRISLQAEDETM